MTKEIDAYTELDLSEGGIVQQDLMMRVDQEAQLSEIHLSDLYDTMPSNLTGSMRQWFMEHVSPMRNAALESVSNYLRNIDRTAHGDPVFEERDRQNLRRDAHKGKQDVLRKDRDAHKAEYERLETLRSEEQKARRNFETLRSRHGREPKEWPKGLYMFVLLIIGLAELGINWESFNAIDYFTPAIATGTAFVIGMALALSSHFSGMTMRQYRARFNDAADDLDRYSGWKMFALAGTTLSIALGAVYYSRIFYFQQLVMDSWGAGSDVSMVKVVGGSMISNLLVWLVGVLIAYMAHDPDPDFPSVKHQLDKISSQREEKSNNIDKRIGKEYTKIDAIYRKENEALENQIRAMSGIAEQREADEMVAKIKAQDDRIKSLLARYQSKLLSVAEPSTVFVRKNSEFAGQEILSSRQYEQNDMVMNYV